jgi:hypothetical protein
LPNLPSEGMVAANRSRILMRLYAGPLDNRGAGEEVRDARLNRRRNTRLARTRAQLQLRGGRTVPKGSLGLTQFRGHPR